MSSPKYLPALLAALTFASLVAACVLDVWAKADASEAWTAFLAFGGTLLGVHIPAPAAS